MSDEAKVLAAQLREAKNIIGQMAVQLVELPHCGHCDEKLERRACCIGSYEGAPIAYGCHHCCGHGNEDGWCIRLEQIPQHMTNAHEEWSRAADEVHLLKARVAALESQVQILGGAVA